jgi:hypothetical protein
LKLQLHHFSKIKSHKEVTKQYESKFFLLFCLKKEGSGAGAVPLTNGSGSGRPKNIRTGSATLLNKNNIIDFRLGNGDWKENLTFTLFSSKLQNILTDYLLSTPLDYQGESILTLLLLLLLILIYIIIIINIIFSVVVACLAVGEAVQCLP